MNLFVIFILISIIIVIYATMLHRPKKCAEKITDNLIMQVNNEKLKANDYDKNLQKILAEETSSGFVQYSSLVGKNKFLKVNVMNSTPIYVQNGFKGLAFLNINSGNYQSKEMFMQVKDINNQPFGALDFLKSKDSNNNTLLTVFLSYGYNKEYLLQFSTIIQSTPFQPIGLLLSGDFYNVHINIITSLEKNLNNIEKWILLLSETLKMNKAQPTPVIFETFEDIQAIILTSKCFESINSNMISQFKQCTS
jgi:hypothetical protein